jgi:hypothetical protein
MIAAGAVGLYIISMGGVLYKCSKS